ncbi:unnamed protein product [Moneuplotes crassus]|uniref:Uncharacterized protein n=1 Tax=Euplotes crassus TaxID=5936 RepID=A0AAD1UA69_EUPCR|nr:unnamed protein product [Moneuplotes crassus]
MKFLNTILKEILVFLEFRDITSSQLAFVNKQFYENIVEDPQVIKTLLTQNFGNFIYIEDFEKEEEYQREILQNIAKLKGEEESKIEFVPFYDSPVKELVPLFKLFARKKDKKQLVCTYRSTGGYEQEATEMISIFMEDRSIYYSGKQKNFPNGICCITGIACEEHTGNFVFAKNILQRAIDLDKVFNFKVDIEDMMPLELGDFDPDQKKFPKLYPENMKSKDPSLLNYWLRNRLAFSPYRSAKNVDFKGIGDTPDVLAGSSSNTIVEFDIGIHQALTREKSFAWRKFKNMSTEESSCPIYAYAVLTHDYPIKTEYHPLCILLKKFYDLYDKAEQDDAEGEESDEFADVEGEIDTEETKSNPKVVDTFKKLIKLGLIPKIVKQNANLLEFDQKYYQKVFNSQQNKDEEGKVTLKDAFETSEEAKDAIPFYENLETSLDYYRLRLSAIAYDLDDVISDYNFVLKQSMSGRYISILALDINNVERDEDPNIDIGGIIFPGKIIPSILKLNEDN